MFIWHTCLLYTSAENRYFELYNVKQLPYYEKRLQKFVKLSTDSDYLILSKDRQIYGLLTVHHLSQCESTQYFKAVSYTHLDVYKRQRELSTTHLTYILTM